MAVNAGVTNEDHKRQRREEDEEEEEEGGGESCQTANPVSRCPVGGEVMKAGWV